MMDYYFILLLAVSAYLSIKGEKNPKRKKLFIGIYATLLALAFLSIFDPNATSTLRISLTSLLNSFGSVEFIFANLTFFLFYSHF